MNRTENLVEFITNLRYEDLPPSTIAAAKNMILDSLGIGVAAKIYQAEHDKWIMSIVKALGEKDESTNLVSGDKMPMPCAAMANTILCSDLDFDDFHKVAYAHFGASLASSAVAVGEVTGATGKDLILAVVIGYEVATRVALVVMPGHYDYFHSTGTNTTFGVAAMAAWMMGCSAEEIVHAIGLAATQAAGLLTYLATGDDGMVFNAGKAAFNGIIAAIAAKAGTKGSPEAIEAHNGYGYAYCVTGQPRFELLDKDLGASFEIENNIPKPYPTLFAGHCSIESILCMLEKYPIRAQEIKKVTLRTYEILRSHMCNYNPETMLAAQVSVPYCIASALVTGTMGFECFKPEMIHDAFVRETMNKIQVVSDPETDALFPEKVPTIIDIEMKDGTVYHHEQYYPKGDPHHPFTKEDMEEKFCSLVVPVLGQTRAEEIISACYRLEQVPSAAEFIKLFVKD